MEIKKYTLQAICISLMLSGAATKPMTQKLKSAATSVKKTAAGIGLLSWLVPATAYVVISRKLFNRRVDKLLKKYGLEYDRLPIGEQYLFVRFFASSFKSFRKPNASFEDTFNDYIKNEERLGLGPISEKVFRVLAELYYGHEPTQKELSEFQKKIHLKVQPRV